jgi:hypothetical protein
VMHQTFGKSYFVKLASNLQITQSLINNYSGLVSSKKLSFE